MSEELREAICKCQEYLAYKEACDPSQFTEPLRVVLGAATEQLKQVDDAPWPRHGEEVFFWSHAMSDTVDHMRFDASSERDVDMLEAGELFRTEEGCHLARRAQKALRRWENMPGARPFRVGKPNWTLMFTQGGGGWGVNDLGPALSTGSCVVPVGLVCFDTQKEAKEAVRLMGDDVKLLRETEITQRLREKGMWYPVDPAPPAPLPSERFEPDETCVEAAEIIERLRVALAELEAEKDGD